MPVKVASNAKRRESIDVELNRTDFSLTEKIFATREPLKIQLLIHSGSVDYKSTIDTLGKYVNLSAVELAPLIAASVRTIERSSQARKKLDLVGADRMYRFARVFDLATQMLGDAQRAKRWIRMRSQYLGNKTPLEMLQTEIGARAVEQSLYAIGYGGVA
jgi:putative toxin-antitoxin system antitoxin component (TIGR02293 family)